jgi:hypothetical protein
MGIQYMTHRLTESFLVLFLLSAFTACSKDSSNPAAGGTPAPSPSRILSISATPRQDPPATAQDLIAALDLALASGARGQHLNFTWRQLEPTAGTFSLNDFNNALTFLTTLRSFKLEIVISVLNAGIRETPTDLMNVPFDSSEMKNRFHALVDALFPSANSNILYLSIGNEVDVYLSQHPGDWQAYTSFYQDAVRYLHQRSLGFKIGVTSTYGGASGGDSLNVRNLNDSSDVFILTYYPTDSDFSPRAPSVAAAEIQHMVELSGGRPLILQEVGYPSTTNLGSSGQAQAQFVSNVFGAWITTGRAIPFINFFCLHDFTRTQCDSIAQYRGAPNNSQLKDFLGSLGLRTVDGTPKLAWQAFVDGATHLPSN